MDARRRRRSRLNKNPARGMKNRRIGLGKKAHEYSVAYGSDVIVVIRGPNGHYSGYQSQPGLLQRLQSVSDDQLLGPDDFVISEHANFSSISGMSESLVTDTMDIYGDWSDLFTYDTQSTFPSHSEDIMFHDTDIPLLGTDIKGKITSLQSEITSTQVSTEKSTHEGYSHLVQPKPISLNTTNTILSLLDSFF
ncbi:SRF-type transcription factor (DNA-binding and dimerization domain) domain-containing protein [Trichoderma breve]|uniref:SRF-type transcription factor (DNA-binding and dimerization domain) domain-containing protein n=1 Tax=Trichoderma breve TaxID=2034170 RepID=A0A9W9B3B1_9HYPO|nr:SRF-type transcription factor (DNA-binding and dimerization domain) domain-containing protein [Trichoderma breve]KAJ4854612.1 SRF-type transcription factor (DNA-binding and dimerization domain) domain-containing protein [Trichoderma breve]